MAHPIVFPAGWAPRAATEASVLRLVLGHRPSGIGMLLLVASDWDRFAVD
ncbi:MAG: hypothetical protein QF586_06765 [Arenicellales bacterium]|nr:hypothetical protein [Arenicellales bacterium]MDP7155003.1 hypothetical protein [Arenicellales bacterium]MDP7282818.1 hypothetical protein [Arenicellales bacterium]